MKTIKIILLAALKDIFNEMLNKAITKMDNTQINIESVNSTNSNSQNPADNTKGDK